MPTIAAFLLSITGSLAARVLTSLGIGFMTFAALTTLASAVVSNATSSYQSMPATVLALVNLAGGGTGLGIILAAFVTKASLMAIKKLRVL